MSSGAPLLPMPMDVVSILTADLRALLSIESSRSGQTAIPAAFTHPTVEAGLAIIGYGIRIMAPDLPGVDLAPWDRAGKLKGGSTLKGILDALRLRERGSPNPYAVAGLVQGEMVAAQNALVEHRSSEFRLAIAVPIRATDDALKWLASDPVSRVNARIGERLANMRDYRAIRDRLNPVTRALEAVGEPGIPRTSTQRGPTANAFNEIGVALAWLEQLRPWLGAPSTGLNHGSSVNALGGWDARRRAR